VVLNFQSNLFVNVSEVKTLNWTATGINFIRFSKSLEHPILALPSNNPKSIKFEPWTSIKYMITFNDRNEIKHNDLSDWLRLTTMQMHFLENAPMLKNLFSE
jgi:hypothetical protein